MAKIVESLAAAGTVIAAGCVAVAFVYDRVRYSRTGYEVVGRLWIIYDRLAGQLWAAYDWLVYAADCPTCGQRRARIIGRFLHFAAGYSQWTPWSRQRIRCAGPQSIKYANGRGIFLGF